MFLYSARESNIFHICRDRGMGGQTRHSLQHLISAGAYPITSHFDACQVWPLIDRYQNSNFDSIIWSVQRFLNIHQFVAYTHISYKIRLTISTNSFNLIYLFQMNFNKNLHKLILIWGWTNYLYIKTKLSFISKNLVATATPSVFVENNDSFKVGRAV